MQTESQFKLWRELQLVGIELIERNWPTTAAYVRLGVALGEAIQRGLATDVDYNNFERLHPVITRRNRVDRPCWMREVTL